MAGTELGYGSTRPDNDFSTGPDVLWVDELENKVISFELKTDKVAGSELTKKEVGQSHDHMQWVATNYADFKHIRHFIVGDGLRASAASNPNPDWRCTTSAQLLAVVASFIEAADKIRNFKVEIIGRSLQAAADAKQWSSEDVESRLTIGPLAAP